MSQPENYSLFSDLSNVGKMFSLVAAVAGTVVGVGAIGGGIYIMAARKELPIWSGIAMLIVGILMIIGGWVWYAMTRKSKALAAGTAAIGLVDGLVAGVRGTA